jgi:Protein of unknown function (DUF1189).
MTTGNNTLKLAKSTVQRKFSPWRSVYLAFYSPKIYIDAARSWKGLGFQYLVLLLVCLWTITALNVQYIVGTYLDAYLIPLLEQIPELMITNGVMRMKSDKDVVYVKDPRDGRILITFDLRPELVDTSKEGLSEVKEPEQEGIYVYPRKAYYKSKSQFQLVEFSSSWESPYQPASFLPYLTRFKNWIGVVVLAIFWLASFVLCAIQALIYGLIGKLIALMNKCPLTYQQIVRISVVALTPVLILDTLQKLIGMGLPAWTLLSIVVAIVYVYFGVKANSIRATLATIQSSEEMSKTV